MRARSLWIGFPWLRACLVPELREATSSPAAADADLDLPEGFGEWDRSRQMQYVEFKTRLAGWINLGLDLSAMSGSVEPRLPFLDHEFVELCAMLPPRFRRSRVEKYIFRKAMEPFLPREILWREKRGMRSPDPALAPGSGPPPDWLEELLCDRVVRSKGYFDPQAVAALRREKGDRGGTVSQIAALHLWDEQFVQGKGYSG